VLGILAVGRAFGDASLKPPVQGHKSLTAEPEITVYQPSSNDTFIIMATDGLWDVLSSQVNSGLFIYDFEYSIL
jgi:serine/threonine protein phosphatase PrpC